MSWFYVRDHQIVGPIETAEFATLVTEGVVGPSTLVWREGIATWTHWSDVQPPSLADLHVTETASRNLSVSVSEIWWQARQWFRREPWKLMGLVTGSTVVILIISTVSFAMNLLLPVASSLVAAFCVGPLQTGVLLMLLEWIRGGRLELATVWRCFGPRYWPLVTGQMVLQVAFTVVGLIAVLGLAPMFTVAYLVNQDPTSVAPEIALPVLLLGAIGGIVGIVIYFYFAVAWLFAPLLILERGLSFWPAMQLSRRVAYAHPWSFSWFLLVVSTLAFAGILLLGVGLFVTLPLSALMLVLAYEQQFGNTIIPQDEGAPPLIPQADLSDNPSK